MKRRCAVYTVFYIEICPKYSHMREWFSSQILDEFFLQNKLNRQSWTWGNSIAKPKKFQPQ